MSHGRPRFCYWRRVSYVKAFQNVIKGVVIAQYFELHIIKSDLIRYFKKCASESCPWHVHAVNLSNAPTFIIRSLEGTHTCGINEQIRLL